MSNPTALFPQGHALGVAFYNREQERAKLKASFLNHEHTVVVAPRRYGKSSLIRQVLLETKIYGKRIDLLPATNLSFVYKSIKACVSEIVNEIAPSTKRAKQRLIEFIKKLHPKLTLSLLGQQLELTTISSSESSIVDLLTGLNVVASRENKKIVICFDEFQQLGLLKDHHSIEASIRHAVESSTHVTYVFSGSSRHLLSQMFNSKSRPLYHLCDLMRLDRIEENTYFSILQARANKQWQCTIDDDVIQEILNLTKCHSYYVNALCRQLWQGAKPTLSLVQQKWLDYVESQSSWITDDLARISPSQRNILAALAYNAIFEPYSQEFSNIVKIGASSIKGSLDVLLRNDFVFKTAKGQYRVLDPAIETYLHKINYFDFSG